MLVMATLPFGTFCPPVVTLMKNLNLILLAVELRKARFIWTTITSVALPLLSL